MKLRLCPDCSDKLNYHSKKRQIKKEIKETLKLKQIKKHKKKTQKSGKKERNCSASESTLSSEDGEASEGAFFKENKLADTEQNKTVIFRYNLILKKLKKKFFYILYKVY